jgi:hypothetical protein
VLVIASEANAPVSHPETVLGRLDIDQALYVALSGLCKVSYRVDHTALYGPIKLLQVS